MVSAINRKLLRELRHQRGQVLSIALLVACGVIAVVGMRSAYDSLDAALRGFYRGHRFADVFATLTRAPEGLARRIREIDGVAVTQTRVTAQATLSVPGLDGPATALLVSAPAAHPPTLNSIYLFRGRHVDPTRHDEVVASTRFAAANGLRLGDTLSAVIKGRWQRLRIVGIGSSPDHLYEVATSTFFADNQRFGILWMSRDALAAAMDMEGGFNTVSLTLAPGGDAEAVIAQLDHLLGRYGGVGAVARANQPSNMVLVDELHQLRATATVFPLFFLGIAAFLLNVVLSRLIATQRDAIGTLKAFGYSNRAVGAHYLGFALAAVVLGAVLGVIGGIWLGHAFTGLYDDYFGFPNLVYRTRPLTILAGIGVSGGAALGGALWAVRSAVSLPPAEAMRPASPARFRRTLLERFGLGAAASLGLRMAMRTLERRPLRTAASTVGIALACAVLIGGVYPFDAVDRMLDTYFVRAQREDLSVAFSTPRPARVRYELAGIDGVTRVELTRAAAVRLRHGHIERTIAIQGIEATARLRRLVGSDGRTHALPMAGLVITTNLARVLDARVGDQVELDVLERGVTRSVAVAGVLDESIGTSAYMERRALNRLLLEGDVATGAALTVNPGAENAVAVALRSQPVVAGIASRAALVDYFERTIADSILLSGGVVIFAAIVIAIGVVYNGARVALAERARELASLRVLGFTRREVSGFFLGEQGIVTIAGLPLGAAAGLGFAAILAAAFGSERHRFSVFIEGTTYAFGVGIVAITALAVALVVRRRVDRLDLIATLKTGD
ncbi:MAG: ABC transporter permease [Gemmatimonadaceae bacterium]